MAPLNPWLTGVPPDSQGQLLGMGLEHGEMQAARTDDGRAAPLTCSDCLIAEEALAATAGKSDDVRDAVAGSQELANRADLLSPTERLSMA